MQRTTENPGFSMRAAVVGVVLSLFLLMSSLYISLKIGALPWPIIFSVVFSGGLLKLLSRSQTLNIHEVNNAQAAASIGGLVAAGIAFTVPGILYLNQTRGLSIDWPNPWILGGLTALAGLLGIVLSVPLKYTFVDKEKLPYPAGMAGAELLRLGMTGGRPLFLIMMIGCAAAIFALFRDLRFPAGFTVSGLATFGIIVALYPMPLGIGAGFILGTRAGFSWFLGAVIGWGVIMPLLFQSGAELSSTRALVQNLGMGILLGAGIGFFLSYLMPRLRTTVGSLSQMVGQPLRFAPLLAAAGFAALFLAGVPWLAAFLTLLGVWVTVAVAARMTGETNIDPLEQFGILVGLAVALTYQLLSLQLNMYATFMIVTFVSVATAIAGDAGHDYKSAAIIGTRFFDIVKADLIAVVFAGMAAPFAFEIIRRGFAEALFTPAMPAPQAQLVAGSIFGFEHPRVFAAGFAIGLLLEIGGRFLPTKITGKIMLMPLGIGMFLGFGLAIPLAVGAAIRALVDRWRPGFYQSGLLIAAGIMGGEGIAGFAAGGLTALQLQPRTGYLSLMLVFACLAIVAFVAFLGARPNTET